MERSSPSCLDLWVSSVMSGGNGKGALVNSCTQHREVKMFSILYYIICLFLLPGLFTEYFRLTITPLNLVAVAFNFDVSSTHYISHKNMYNFLVILLASVL
ncbi:hypothetical protein NE237_025105 [Protea cynaroides]|uniref:Uncharacterized protein n=1 Tax=Protea cynaroides TaxID=273540 RepID=A0A9Q0JZ70_9MAGN|nr:hypothetical protein NE237_025105 [Protea cynaroides]